MVNRKISLTTFTLQSVIQNGIHSWCSCLEGGQRWIYAWDKLPSIVRKNFWTVDCLHALHRGLNFYWLWQWPPKQRLDPQKSRLNWFWNWTVFMRWLGFWLRWETKSWPFKGLLSPKQSFPWSWSVIWRHGLTKKKRKKKKTVSGTGLSLCADQDFDFAQEMED